MTFWKTATIHPRSRAISYDGRHDRARHRLAVLQFTIQKFGPDRRAAR